MQEDSTRTRPRWTSLILSKVSLKELKTIHVSIKRNKLLASTPTLTAELERNIDDPALISKLVHKDKGGAIFCKSASTEEETAANRTCKKTIDCSRNSIGKSIFNRHGVFVNPAEDFDISNTCRPNRRRSRSKSRSLSRGNREAGTSRRDDRTDSGSRDRDTDRGRSKSDHSPLRVNERRRRTRSRSSSRRTGTSKRRSPSKDNIRRRSRSRSRERYGQSSGLRKRRSSSSPPRRSPSPQLRHSGRRRSRDRSDGVHSRSRTPLGVCEARRHRERRRSRSPSYHSRRRDSRSISPASRRRSSSRNRDRLPSRRRTRSRSPWGHRSRWRRGSRSRSPPQPHSAGEDKVDPYLSGYYENIPPQLNQWIAATIASAMRYPGMPLPRPPFFPPHPGMTFMRLPRPPLYRPRMTPPQPQASTRSVAPASSIASTSQQPESLSSITVSGMSNNSNREVSKQDANTKEEHKGDATESQK